MSMSHLTAKDFIRNALPSTRIRRKKLIMLALDFTCPFLSLFELRMQW